MSPIQPDTRATNRLENPWLALLRAAWVLFVLMAVVLLVVGFPAAYQARLVVCDRADCPELSITAERLAAYEGAGLSPEFVSAWDAAMLGAGSLAFIAIAAFIFARRSADPVALLAAFLLVALPVASPQNIQISDNVVVSAGLRLASIVATGGMTGFLLLFPSGHFVPRWSRYYFYLFVGVIGLINGLIVANVVSVEAEGIYFFFLFIPLLSQIYRYLRVSQPEERQQTKWVIASIGGLLFLVPVQALLLTFSSPVGTIAAVLIGSILGFLSLLLLPLGIFIAVQKQRLWDIDFIINRGVVYAATTALLVGVFVAIFFTLRAILTVILGGGEDVIAVGASVAATVGLFNPARRFLRDFVDRQIYGIQIDYATPARHDVRPEEPARAIGPYSDLQQIGSGGMGEVYRATHPRLKRSVALKVLPGQLALEEEFRRRFEREAEIVTGLTHPNIVQMYEFGQADDTFYMVMEYVEGPDLHQLLREQGRLSLPQAGAILADITAALDHAHEQGIVHRDIKPSNVMLEPAGQDPGAYRAVLMDFGIAKIATAATRLTLTGMIGTLDYIAPEQIQGAADVDRRADIYALGVMTYQMLTGELPFHKNNPGALVLAHLMEPPPDARTLLPDLPPTVAAALQKAMAKNPADRFANTREMMAGLGSSQSSDISRQ